MSSFHTPCSCAWYLHWVHITHVVFANSLSMYIVFTWLNIMLQFAPTLFICRVFAWVHITHVVVLHTSCPCAWYFTCVHFMLQFAPTLFMCRVFACVHITHVVVLDTSCPTHPVHARGIYMCAYYMCALLCSLPPCPCT